MWNTVLFAQSPTNSFWKSLFSHGEIRFHVLWIYPPNFASHLCCSAQVSVKVKWADWSHGWCSAESHWGQLCQDGRERTAQLCPGAHTKYMSFLTVCVTFIYHLLHELDPDVHTLRMRSYSHENVLEFFWTYDWIHTTGRKKEPLLDNSSQTLKCDLRMTCR